jgi:hypothetical protein
MTMDPLQTPPFGLDCEHRPPDVHPYRLARMGTLEWCDRCGAIRCVGAAWTYPTEWYRREEGERINSRASVGAEIVALERQIEEQEKLARKTPPKTLHAEWAKVTHARATLNFARGRLAELKDEYRALRMQPAQHDRGESCRQK